MGTAMVNITGMPEYVRNPEYVHNPIIKSNQYLIFTIQLLFVKMISENRKTIEKGKIKKTGGLNDEE